MCGGDISIHWGAYYIMYIHTPSYVNDIKRDVRGYIPLCLEEKKTQNCIGLREGRWWICEKENSLINLLPVYPDFLINDIKEQNGHSKGDET